MRIRLLRLAGCGAVVSAGILTILGSGGGKGVTPASPAGDAATAIKAFNFDANNSATAARTAAAVMSLFPDFTMLDRRAMTTLSAADPGNSPFDLAMCVNAGHSLLTWFDADHSGDLSTGDSASLQLSSCDLDGNGATATGTVQFGLTSIDGDPLPNSVTVNASMNFTVENGTDTTAYSASFGAASSTADAIDFINTYTARDSSDQKVTITKSDGTVVQFACFHVVQTSSTADGAGTYRLSSSGVINASNTVMSLADGAQLSFVDNHPESGTKRLLSSSVPHCATLGIPDGVAGSDGSYLDMEALGGGAIRLHTFDAANVEFFTTDTDWDALLN